MKVRHIYRRDPMTADERARARLFARAYTTSALGEMIVELERRLRSRKKGVRR